MKITKEIENDDNIIKMNSNSKFPNIRGIGEIVFDLLNTNKDSPFQIDGITGEIDTYDSFLKRCIRTAIKMRSEGVTRGDVVTICSVNHFDTNVPVIASLFLGVKTASIDPALAPSDAAHLLQLVKPKMIFVSPNGVDLIETVTRKIKINPKIVVFGKTYEYTEFSEFVVESPEEKDFLPVQIKDVRETASIFFSSGTTGLAKGICLSHVSLFPATMTAIPNTNSSSSVTLSYSSPYWISSVLMLLVTIATKGCRLVIPTFEIDHFWECVEKHKVDVLLLSPTQLAILAKNKKPDGVKALNLKFLLTSGSTVYTHQLDVMKEYFPNAVVATTYGQTELGGACFTLGTDEIKHLNKNQASCGRPIPGVSYKIVDLETEKPLGPNQSGELRVKSAFCMNGYHNVDSTDCWDSDGFLKTGDVAYYDENFCFYIVDRLKDMLKFQGWQITPAKLEAILLDHPAVQAALVFGLPHPVDCDHPMGVVQLKKSAKGVVTDEDILKYYNENIDDDKHRLRGGLKIIDDMPITPSGKYKRNHIKNLVLALAY